MKKRIVSKDLIVTFPLNPRQQDVFQYFYEGYNLSLLGSAGTGKTMIAMYLGLSEVLRGNYSSLIVVRSAVPTRDVGFLPGTLEEKLADYEAPYAAICDSLFPFNGSWECLKAFSQASFLSTSFLRGVTIDNSIIIVDECQSLSFHELDTIITRVGTNSKIIFCGDTKQSDIRDSGLGSFSSILDRISSFKSVTFSSADIVRSGLVKDYIIARDSSTIGVKRYGS